MTKISEYAERVDIIRERHKKFLDELDKNNIDYFSERNSILASENTELAYENTLKQGTSDQTLIFAMDASRAAIKANLDTRLLLQGQVEANKLLKEIRLIVTIIGGVAVSVFVQGWL